MDPIVELIWSKVWITKAITISNQKLSPMSIARSCWQLARFELSNCWKWADVLVVYKVCVTGDVDKQQESSQQFGLSHCWRWADLLVIYKIISIAKAIANVNHTILLTTCTVWAITLRPTTHEKSRQTGPQKLAKVLYLCTKVARGHPGPGQQHTKK